MSYNGSGTFLINTAGQPVVSGTVISSTAFNALTADLATGLSTAITKDGQTTVTANIPMGTYKFTGLGAGTAATDSANLSQVQSTVTKLLASVSGADTITAVGSPTLGAYAAGQMFYFVAASANTGAVTINIDSLGAKSITRDGTTALAAGDIQSGEVCVIVYDGTQFQLVNGASQSASIVTENLTVNKATVLNESGGDNDTRIEGDTDANLFFADASTDRIGIGTSSPATKLEVSNGAITAGSSGTVLVGRNSSSFPSPGAGYFSLSTNNTDGSNGGISFNTLSSDVLTERMRLDASGNLGVGTTSPGNRLHVSGNSGDLVRVSGAAKTLYINCDSGGGGIFTGAAQTGAAYYLSDTNGYAAIFTSSTERVRITSAGDVGIGTTNPGTKLSVNGAAQIMAGNALNFQNAAADSNSSIVNNNSAGASNIAFNTGGTERARITAGGYSKFSSNGTYINSTGTYHEFYQSANADGLRVYCSDNSAYNNSAVIIECARTTTNSTYNLFYVLNGNASGQCLIRDSGNIVNTNGSYGALSDQKLKQDIVDAASQWDDIKSLRVRKYRFKDKPDEALQIGIIAQELEQVSPGLVEESVDRDKEGNDLGTTTKSVKYSVLYMKAVKALQEAMARIESLEAKVAALEAK